LPRFAALRRIPAQAFGLKKNLGGIASVTKMRDNEDSTASLGNSEVLSVQHSEGPPIPELAQRPEEGSKIPSSVRRQDTGDVLPDQPRDSETLCQSEVDEHEVSSGVGETWAETGDREGLTGGAAHENVNCAWFKVPLLVFGHVPVVLHRGEAVGEDRRRERFDLREADRRPAEVVPCNRGGFDATTHGQVAHHFTRMGMTIA
jgi:hypothetical protein